MTFKIYKKYKSHVYDAHRRDRYKNRIHVNNENHNLPEHDDVDITNSEPIMLERNEPIVIALPLLMQRN